MPKAILQALAFMLQLILMKLNSSNGNRDQVSHLLSTLYLDYVMPWKLQQN